MSRCCELQILDLLRAHLSASQFSHKAYGTEITTTQASLIDELARDPTLQIDRIAELLCVNRSTVSRCISQLNNVGMVKSQRAQSRGRLLQHLLTSKGRKFATFQSETSERLFSRGLNRLLKEEVDQLRSFLITLLGHDPATSLSTSPDESWISFVFRGLTYEHGVLSGDYLQSGYSVRDWVVLSEIHYAGRTPTELAALMQTSPSTITVWLTRYVHEDLIWAKKDPRDKRVKEFTLTPSGLAVVNAIESRAKAIFGRNLSHIEPDELQKSIAIFQRYVNGVSGDIGQTLQWTEPSHDQRIALRVVAARYISDLGDKYPNTGFLLHPHNRVFIANGSSTSLLVELAELRGTNTFQLVNVIPLGDAPQKLSISFVAATLKDSFDIDVVEIAEVKFPFPPRITKIRKKRPST